MTDEKNPVKLIVAQMHADDIDMYRGQLIPVVMFSDHPRYTPGTRFDYGFLQCALNDGYTVHVLPATADELRNANALRRQIVAAEMVK